MRTMCATGYKRGAARTVKNGLKSLMAENQTCLAHVHLGVRPSFTYRSRCVMKCFPDELRNKYLLE